MSQENIKLIYTIASEHLLKQRARSAVLVRDRSTEDCLYRGDEGLKCAVGALIKDEFYEDIFEGKAADDPYVIDAVEKSLGIEIDIQDIGFMLDLQTIHDGCPVSRWEEDLQRVARAHRIVL